MIRLLAHRTLAAALAAALVLLSCAQRTHSALRESSTDRDARLHVIVLHTNDVHGQVLPRPATWTKQDPPPLAGGLPRVAAAVNRVRREAEQSGSALLVVDAGDWSQGTPEGAVDEGLGFTAALVAVGYDAMCVGNHELDRGLASLQRCIAEAHVPAVCANVTQRDPDRPIDGVAPYLIVERAGLRIALVGLLTPETPSITHRDARTLAFEPTAKALERVREQLAGKFDWILPLTHQGVDDDRALARVCAGLPLIVGGHSHTVLRQGVREEGTLIVQAGSKASALGRVDLWFDRATKQCVEARARLIELLDEPRAEDVNAAVQAICARLTEEASREMQTVVAELAEPLFRAKQPFVSSTAGNWITDALREYTEADVAFMNRGGIRSDVAAGPLTRRELFELTPFDNAVTTLDLTGAELERIVARSVKTSGGLEFSGLVARLERPRHGATGARTLESIDVGGQPLDRTATYRVALNSFLADGGDVFFEEGEGRNRVDDPRVIHEALEIIAKKHGRVVPDAGNRYVLVTR